VRPLHGFRLCRLTACPVVTPYITPRPHYPTFTEVHMPKRSKMYSILHRTLAGFFRRVLVRVRIHGAENLPTEGGVVVCANHISNFDPVILAAALPRQVRFMAKIELFKIPLLGGALKMLGAFPVDRGAMDVGAVKTSIKLLKEGELVGIFPQGTRHKAKPPHESSVRHGAGMFAAKSESTLLPVFIGAKGHKIRLFRRLDLYIGEPITYESLNVTHANMDEYVRISQFVFGEICALADKHGGER